MGKKAKPPRSKASPAALNLNAALDAASQHYGAGRLRQAGILYDQVLQVKPNHPDALLNLGIIVHQLGNTTAGIQLMAQATLADPGFSEAHYTLARVLEDIEGREQEAIAGYRRAITLKPTYAEAYTGLGYVLEQQARFMDALECYGQALRLNPNCAQTHFNRAWLWLLTGQFKLGWAEYEWRWLTPSMSGGRRSFPQPVWNGSSLTGKTILLHAEQGFGDTLQFIRYAPSLRAGGARVIVECFAPLKRLFAACEGVDELLVQGESLPDFDVHAPLMSLPRLLDTESATIPDHIPYLQAPQTCRLPPGLQAALGAPTPARKVGLVWSPKLQVPMDYKRYCPLVHFEPVLGVPGVSFFSLYKGDRIEELTPYRGVVDVGSQCTDFADTAWAIAQLDLVITVDTAVAHLAGAMGKPTWVLLPFVPDWRWLLEREDSPWYPTARLFRQPYRGAWAPALEQVAASLRQYLLPSTPDPACGHKPSQSN